MRDRMVTMGADALGRLVRAAEAAMGQTEAGLEALRLRALAAEQRRDALWARLKDAERTEAYYAELAKKDRDFEGTADSHKRLRRDLEKLFEEAQAAYDKALGSYLMMLHEYERAQQARPAQPGKQQGAAWPTAPAAPGRWDGYAPWAAGSALDRAAAGPTVPFTATT
jgi:hypothetical protein